MLSCLKDNIYLFTYWDSFQWELQGVLILHDMVLCCRPELGEFSSSASIHMSNMGLFMCSIHKLTFQVSLNFSLYNLMFDQDSLKTNLSLNTYVLNMKTTWCLRRCQGSWQFSFWLRMRSGHIVHCRLNLIKKFKDYRCFASVCLLSKDYCLP